MVCEATRRQIGISFSRYSGGKLSRARPRIELASLKILSVGSLRGLESRASVGQWPNWVRSRRVCAWAMYPLSVSLFVVRTRCSIPIWVALFLIEGRPSPISLSGLCTPSMGKLGSRPMAWRMALFRMPSMVVSCRSLSTPRCAAWYPDFRSYSTTRVLYGGPSFLFVRAFTSLRTSLVILVKCLLFCMTCLGEGM